MKKSITFLLLVVSLGLYSQDSLVKPDMTTFEEARAFSKEDELVVFIIAGREYNAKSDAEITGMLKRITANGGLRLNVFIQRTEKRYTSTYFTFMDGKACSDETNRTGLGSAIADCLGRLSGSLRRPE